MFISVFICCVDSDKMEVVGARHDQQEAKTKASKSITHLHSTIMEGEDEEKKNDGK
jgi:hypothetical protein